MKLANDDKTFHRKDTEGFTHTKDILHRAQKPKERWKITCSENPFYTSTLAKATRPGHRKCGCGVEPGACHPGDCSAIVESHLSPAGPAEPLAPDDLITVVAGDTHKSIASLCAHSHGGPEAAKCPSVGRPLDSGGSPQGWA
jgi:hypothetical protein